MKSIVSLLIPLLASVVSSQKLQISVYYEALCIDTVIFFRDQLVPTYNEYSDKMDLQLIPYGKASHYWNKEANKYEFLCQHGVRECHLNMIHACGLDVMSFESAFSFVSCLLQHRRDLVEARNSCEPIIKANEKAQSMNECMAFRVRELLAAHGNKTMEIGLTFVPTIVPENDTCYKRRDNLYQNFRQAFQDEYALKYQKYPNNTVPNETQKRRISNLCGAELPLSFFL